MGNLFNPVKRNTLSLDFVMGEYIKNEASANNHTDRAKRCDLEHFRLFVQTRNNRPTLSDLNRSIVVEFLDHRLHEVREAPATVNRRLATLKTFFRRTSEVIKGFRNPTVRLVGARVERKRPQSFSLAEIEKFRALDMSARDRLIFELLYGCGLRCFEVPELTLENLGAGLSTLTRVRRKGNLYQDVVCPVPVQLALAAWLPEREELLSEGDHVYRKLPALQRRRYPLVASNYGKVSGDPSSWKIGTKTIWSIIRDLGEQIGIEGARPHLLRHSIAHHIQDQCKDITITARHLGHSNITTTQVYCERGEFEIRAVLRAMDEPH